MPSVAAGADTQVCPYVGSHPSANRYKAVNEALAELHTTRLPAGVNIVPLYDRTDLVSNTLHTVTRTLGALDVGIIVDGTLVMVEHLVHKRSEHERDPQHESGGTIAAIHDAAIDIAQPLFFSLVIIIAAYRPLFTMERAERRLFEPMAFTVASALLGSLILSLTLIPVLATCRFKHGAKAWENPVIRSRWRPAHPPISPSLSLAQI